MKLIGKELSGVGVVLFSKFPYLKEQYLGMISEEKIREVRKYVSNGEPEGEVREILLREGYSQEDIDKAFAPQPYDMRSWYLIFGCVFALGGLWVLARNGSLLGLGFSGLLFVQYYRETIRVRKENARQNPNEVSDDFQQ